MGTVPGMRAIRARLSRAEEDAIGAVTGRLEKRLARAGAIEKTFMTFNESQTVLITLLSCWFMSDIK